MNLLGRPIDVDLLDVLYEKANTQQFNLMNEMKQICGFDFKPFSPRDITKILYEDLKLPVLKTSKKTGAPSSDKEVLDQLANINPFPAKLKEYRSLNKFIKAYILGIGNIVKKVDKLYASFSQVGADSGRFSCPSVTDENQEDMTVNLQNQPKGKSIDIRKAFIAPEDFVVVCCDFS